MKYNPCIHGLMSDMKFYRGMAKNYIETAKASVNDKRIRKMFINYAEESIKAAEVKLEEIRRLE